MALIAGGALWATGIGTGGSFWEYLAGPFLVAGAGTAFAFIPTSIAALTGATAGESGIASGLLSTSQQIGGALGVAVVSTVAATRTATLVAAGDSPAGALVGGFHGALWVCAGIAAVAVPIAGFVIPQRRTASAAAPPALSELTRSTERSTVRTEGAS